MGRAAALLLLASALAGCETMERMDYFDRFFEPPRFTEAAARPVAAVEPIPDPPARLPGGWNNRADAVVVAMEPIPNPPSRPKAGWGTDADDVVAMEPIRNPPSGAPSGPPKDRSAVQLAARTVEPAPGAAPTPEVDAESRTRSLVRQNAWLTRFWMELTPAQQGRVARRLGRGDAPPAAGAREGVEAAWDRMGLADRAALVFGGGSPGQSPAPAEAVENPMVAGNR